jgi:RNA polymerase sigma-70 factor (ECF subfamily)
VAVEPTDAEIIVWSLDEPAVFTEIFDRHFAPVFGYIGSALGRQAAEDIASEVFLRAFEARHRFDPAYRSAKSWLFGIASNLIQDHLRRLARRYRANQRSVTSEIDSESFEDEVASRLDAEASAPLVVEALRALRPEEASVVLLRVLEDMAYRDIADSLGIPIGTVRSRLSRARVNLRNFLSIIDELDIGDNDE